MQRRDASLVRRARAVAALAIGLLLLTADIPSDPSPVMSPTVLAVLVVLVLLFINIVDPARQREVSGAVLRRAAIAELALDSLVMIGVVWIAGVDSRGPVWVLLVLPILEAALRFGARTAMSVLAAMCAVYIGRDVWSAARYDDVSFSPATVAQRVGILMVVGATAGFLAAELAREAARHRQARADAERHAKVLEVVAASTSAMTSLDADDALHQLALAAHRLGVERVGVARWNGVRFIGHRAGSDDVSMALLAERMGVELARARRPLSMGPDQIASLVSDASSTSAVGIPIADRVGVVASMVADGPVSDETLGALRLLADHVGVVLAQASSHAEIRRLQQRLAHQAFHDSLTGLPNRASFAARFNKGRERRATSATGIAVLFIDLDGFKAINDDLGHAAGDELLTVVARRIRDTLRPYDTVARLGGDEFVALLERVGDAEGARAAAERLLVVLEAPVDLAVARVRVGASIGLVYRDDTPSDIDQLLQDADRAMYEAKRTGKGRVVSLDGLDDFHQAAG